ncbi:MAG: hypothetical protein HQ481_07445 [Alphaproteobacteria bacterium]|nr:hypothetical protein [Alphaproteobacteria bacterium]
MSVGWRDLGANGQALAEAVYTALDRTAELRTAGGDDEAPPSSSTLWAWVMGGAETRDRLAATWRRYPALKDDVAALLDRAAVASLPRVAAAATEDAVARRIGTGAAIRLLPSRATPDQTYVVITLDDPDRTPGQLIAVTGDDLVVQRLDPPVDGTIQVLTETASDLVRALADAETRVWLL